ncbi:MAG: hypothetical protein ACPGVO_22980 [Spirulinaceae cyanobacterium]
MTPSTAQNLAQLLRQCERDRTYSHQLTQVTGAVTATVLLAWLWETAQDNPWVYDSSAIAHQTGLSLPEQEFARQQLRRRGLLGELLVGDRLQLQIQGELLAHKLQSLQQIVPHHPAERRSLTERQDQFLLARRSPPRTPVTPDYQFIGPWDSAAQLEAFQRALWDYYLQQGSRNPREQVFYIVDGLTKGLVSPLWDDFIQGQPLGSSQQLQRDWEIAPGRPYPAFEEERIQYYCHKGEPIEVATAKARADLRQPTLAQDLWEGFLRKCDRLANEAQRAQQQGVQTPYLPSTFAAPPTPSKQAVMAKLNQLQPPEQLTPPSPAPAEKPGIPSLAALRQAYANPMGRTLVMQQIQQHPEWGYGIFEGEVVDLEPF